MFKTLKNAWGIIDLKKKLLFTALIIVLYRLGSSIPVPFIDQAALESASFYRGNVLEFLNILSGGALGQATLFALGVSPYITASIVVQLLTVAIPALERWSKEGEEGKKKINVLTRIITVALALVTSIGYVALLSSKDVNLIRYATTVDAAGNTVYANKFLQNAIIVICYCAGAAIVMWLAEKINESGIGNGISIILFANIIAGFYTTLALMWRISFGTVGFDWLGLVLSLAFIALLLGLILVIVWMSDAERRIPIQYAKRVVGRKMYGGQNTNLPLKVNMTGVMPIIFANSIVTIPATIAEFTKKDGKFGNWVSNVFSQTSILYLVIFMLLLVAFAYFYVLISFNPIEVANNIKNNGGAIPGIRSGRPTIEFVKKVLYRVTLVGALLIVLIACLPMVINDVCNLDVIKNAINARGIGFGLTEGSKALENYQALYTGLFSTLAFGGSSLMIVVGVALETTRELEAQMSLRNYKGFLD